jgi:large subunit ribosomal protein L5
MEHVDVAIPLKEVYRTRTIPALLAASKQSNPMAVARIRKVVVNAGIGKFLKEEQRVEEIVRSMTEITGQKPVLTQAKKAIAGFKIREGLTVGVKVTLRGDRMWDFLDRLIKTAFPRVRDFQGIAPSVVDENGHLNVGIREHSVFPEIIPEKVQTLFGLQVTVVTTATTKEEGLILAKSLGFPLRDTN